MRTYFRILLLVSILAAIAVGNSPVSAQTGCTIRPSSLAYTSPNYSYGDNNYVAAVLVPVSVTCSFVGGQLYATGSAINPSTNARVDAVAVALSSAYGTNIYTGQLAFSIPAQVTGYTLQISISIYSGVTYNYGAYGSYSYGTGTPITTSVETVQVNTNSNYVNYAGCYYGYNCAPNAYAQVVNSCSTPSSDGTVQCIGYLYEDQNSCFELVIPIPVLGSRGAVYSQYSQYYTLQQLPASYPAIGTWVSVTGQLHQGPNFSSTGASCPGNYINVNSITP
jgi:hypothetical protein